MVARDLSSGEEIVLINPHILSFSDPKTWKGEGCLSFPGISFDTTRFMQISMSYMAITGERKEVSATDLFAVELQHEFDHLDGVTAMKFITGSMTRNMIASKLKRYKLEQQRLAKKNGWAKPNL